MQFNGTPSLFFVNKTISQAIVTVEKYIVVQVDIYWNNLLIIFLRALKRNVAKYMYWIT